MLLAFAGLQSPSLFYSSENLHNIFNQLAIPGILAVGMTFVILTGGIDLSVGSHIAFLNCVAATWLKAESSLLVSSAYTLALGAGIGALLGWIIGVTKLQPFVVTLAAMVSLQGISFIYTKNQFVSGIGPYLEPLKASLFGIPLSGLLLVAVMTAGVVLLGKGVLGRRIYAVGGNEEAARFSGVPVARTKIAAYALNGVCVAIAALLLTARTDSGQQSPGAKYELDAIAAVVVGGSSLLGGRGNVLGSVIGALFILSTDNLFNLNLIDDKIALAVKGGILLLAVYLQNLGRQR